MKKLILLLSIAVFASCNKTETPERCAQCLKLNGQLWSLVCESELDTMTINEYVDYWDNAGDLNCAIK